MGKNNSDLRKFILEDGRIVLIEQRYPVETSPRIDSLFNFLQDMGYLDEDNTLTEIASQFIENYGKNEHAILLDIPSGGKMANIIQLY